MQKERITIVKAKKHCQTARYLRRYGRYIAVALVLFTTIAIVTASAAVKGSQQEEKTVNTGNEDVVTGKITKNLESRPNTEESMIYSRDWGAEDAELLLKIAMAEAEGETTEGKAMVMLVVLNRTWSEDFPDNIEDVIFQTDPERQFSVTAEGGRWWTTTPDKDCVAALELVESGWDNSWGALYFESSGKENSWHSRNLDFLFQLGNHKFYK